MGFCKREQGDGREDGILGSKDGGRTIRQGMQGAFRSWKR